MTDKKIDTKIVDLHSKSKTIKINGKDVVLKKLPLGKYAAILGALKKLPEKLGQFGEISNKKVIQSLPSMISDSLPELLQVLSIASDIPVEELETEYGLDDVTVLLQGIFEVNDFTLVKKNIQNLLKMAKPKTIKTGLKK